MREYNVELHRLFGFVLFLCWSGVLMVHDQGAVFSADVVRISVTIDVHGRWAEEKGTLIDQDKEQHNPVVDPQWLQYLCVLRKQLLDINDVFEGKPKINTRKQVTHCHTIE